jgi:hypothetical protein
MGLLFGSEPTIEEGLAKAAAEHHIQKAREEEQKAKEAQAKADAKRHEEDKKQGMI